MLDVHRYGRAISKRGKASVLRRRERRVHHHGGTVLIDHLDDTVVDDGGGEMDRPWLVDERTSDSLTAVMVAPTVHTPSSAAASNPQSGLRIRMLPAKPSWRAGYSA